MKYRTLALVAVLLGIALIAVALLVPSWAMQDSNVSIIGGAHAPMYTYLFFNAYDGVLFVAALWGGCLVLTGLFCLAFKRTVQTHCTLKTTGLALAISAAGGLGCMCAFLWSVISAFQEMSQRPITYPASIIVGIIALALFVVAIVFYIKSRRKCWSVVGLVLDVLTAILYFPAFFYGICYLYDVARNLI
ncbi:MAG: hypothetical protein E7466_01660 [Ruminococcaceae bacterium]|nr:hypothetical protein [Oscillospiraceae bacterium]